MRTRPLAFIFISALVACGPAPDTTSPAHHDDDHGDDHDDHDESQEVTLSEAAMAVSDIVVGRAERRAIAGGAALPAEVRFEPAATAHVRPIGAGRFTGVSAGRGDAVTQGQLLATVLSSDVADLDGQLAQARARLAGADAELRRNLELVKEGVGADRGVTDARAAVATLRAEVAGLQRRLTALGAQASGEVELRAPIGGLVTHVHAVVGEAVGDEPAFTITDPTRVYVEGFVPELEIGRVAVDMPVLVRTHAFPDMALAGRISAVQPSLDETTRSLPVRVALSAPDPRLKGGMFALIELVHDGGRPVAVPSDGVATLEGQDVVFVPGDAPRTFVPRPVRLGRRANGFVEVESGLAEGDAVVTHGGFVLKSALSKSAISSGHEH